MNRTEQIIFGILGLLFAACSCIVAWLAFYFPEPRPAPSPSNNPLVTFSPSENLPEPTISTSETLPAPTIAILPTPTIEIPTLLPTCQSQVTPLPRTTLPWFNPPLVSGNQGLDFNGNGPRVHVTVNLYVKDTNQIYAKVFMAAQEIVNGNLGPLRAEGDTSTTVGGDFLVGEILRPQDWQLTWPEDSQNADISYFDIDATSDIFFPGDNSELFSNQPQIFGPVEKFEIIGDTMTEDIGQRGGYHTGVQITLKPLNFLVEEKFNCIN